MFGSIGHAARDAKSLSQRSSGHINEVQPDEGVVSVVHRKMIYLGVGCPSKSESILRRFISSEAGKRPA